MTCCIVNDYLEKMRKLFQLSPLLGILVFAGCAHFRAMEENSYEQYSGEYILDENTTAIVRANQGRLMAKISGQDYFELFRSEDARSSEQSKMGATTFYR